MQSWKEQPTEFKIFNTFIEKLLSVPHDELKKREERYKQQKRHKKRLKV